MFTGIIQSIGEVIEISNESLTVSDMWVKPSDDPSTWTINEDLLTGWGRKNINFGS